MNYKLLPLLGLASAVAVAALAQHQPSLCLPRCVGLAVFRPTSATVVALTRASASQDEETNDTAEPATELYPNLVFPNDVFPNDVYPDDVFPNLVYPNTAETDTDTDTGPIFIVDTCYEVEEAGSAPN
jgi:hypothetical protein